MTRIIERIEEKSCRTCDNSSRRDSGRKSRTLVCSLALLLGLIAASLMMMIPSVGEKI